MGDRKYLVVQRTEKEQINITTPSGVVSLYFKKKKKNWKIYFVAPPEVSIKRTPVVDFILDKPEAPSK